MLFPELEREALVEDRSLAEILEQHGDWLDSGAHYGIQAELSGENLESADLIDARLQDAVLTKSILRNADLTLADLRGANLLQADLRDANLLGTQFHQANLQAADMTGATGLVGSQLAGANLFGAVLPETTSPFDGLKIVRQTAARAAWLLAAITLLNALVWLRIFTTRDFPLLTNGPALPFFGLQKVSPFIPFYLFGPVALLCLYVGFHLYLQRLWEGAAQLPAIFPDGRTLDQCLPWFARWSAQTYCKWLRDTRSPLAFLEAGISVVLLYWATPVTTILFWGRYLTLEDLRGSTVQIITVVGAVVAAINFPRVVGTAFNADLLPPANRKPASRKTIARLVRYTPAGIGILLLLLSIGIVTGAPHDYAPATASMQSKVKTWAAQVLWLAGYNPFAQLTETNVSTKPVPWSGRDEDLAQVKGAALNRIGLRHAQAYRAFLVNARLWEADLRYAELSESDLRNANLRQAILEFATLDGARLNRASLSEAGLQNANLSRSDLRDANLTSANLSGATMHDAVLDNANLYKADMHGALLQRASLKQSDLREANLDSTNLTAANLQATYLSSAKLGHAVLASADLSRAILDDADLRSANLSDAKFQGTILRGANLTGANLERADLRGALGLTPAQICSAASFPQAQLDENLAIDVQILCGKSR